VNFGPYRVIDAPLERTEVAAQHAHPADAQEAALADAPGVSPSAMTIVRAGGDQGGLDDHKRYYSRSRGSRARLSQPLSRSSRTRATSLTLQGNNRHETETRRLRAEATRDTEQLKTNAARELEILKSQIEDERKQRDALAADNAKAKATYEQLRHRSRS